MKHPILYHILIVFIIQFYTAPMQCAIISDDFYPETTMQSFWHFVDPRGDCTLTMSGTQAEIDIPAGTSHDPYTSGNYAPRLLQSAPDADFAVEAKFDSVPVSRYQMQGIMVLQTNNVFFRFEIYHNGSSPYVLCAFINGGSATFHKNSALASVPSYLRVARTNDNWTYSYSSDRTNWTVAASFTQAVKVNDVGIYGANHDPNPAYSTRADYFMNMACPIFMIDDPVNFTVDGSQQTEIDLDWEETDENDCMIARSDDGDFGFPENGTTYNLNYTFTGGGKVIYKGGDETYPDTGLSPNTKYYYKIWSYADATCINPVYSPGVTNNATTAPEPAMLILLAGAAILIFRRNR